MAGNDYNCEYVCIGMLDHVCVIACVFVCGWSADSLFSVCVVGGMCVNVCVVDRPVG